ncbi:hypothetical protein AS156_20745 [Bradyrhizobium macuxiense]|uniref:GH26 domain-containing protein n=1 Tax=Bradyrhizobium macuxiense TaxID=1755647 RepID=A0A109JDE5_9BRAD|nr:Ig-like domain-containing protein [Bradyrhizobium macuxiense]KWV46858.1 hypothetical protein AS156_20745 [Bradyrhizobium macuxiense]
MTYTRIIFGKHAPVGDIGNDLLNGTAGSDLFAISGAYGSDSFSVTLPSSETPALQSATHTSPTAHNVGHPLAATDALHRAAVFDHAGSVLDASVTDDSATHIADGAIDDVDHNGTSTDVSEAAAQSSTTDAALNSPSSATVETGASLELSGAYSGSITFAGATGTLVLDHSSAFTGNIFNLTGDGNPLSSDQLDLKDIAYGSGTTVSYAGNSSGGVLTVSDAQDHVAHLSLVGNYTNSTFHLSSDGSGGTTVIDPPTTPYALGVDVGNPNVSDPTEEAYFEANFNDFTSLMGAKPQYLDQFGDQTKPISQWISQSGWDATSVAQSAVLKGVTPVIGLPMSSTAAGSGTADQQYQAFAAGTYDSVLQGMVKAWADNGSTTQIWRVGWEMNISTMPSYAGNDAATQADWVKAYQHIYTVLHAAGAADGVNIQVMWNPGVVNYSDSGNAIQTVYPGNQYVDMIGADVYGDLYPYGDHTHLYDWDLSGQMLNSPNPVYDSSLQQWAADPINLEHYYSYPASNQWSLDGSAGHATTLQELIDLSKSTGKPLAIAETGAGNTTDGAGVVDNPTFVQWLSQTLQQSGANISFVNIWDSNGGGSYQFSNASDGKPLEAAAWASYFGASSVAAPTITSFSPDSNVVGDGATNANQLTLTGTATAGTTVEVFDGTAQIGTVTANASGAWFFSTAPLTDGSHPFTAEDVDASGRVSAPSAALNVTVDTVAPAAPVLASFSPDSNIVGDDITNANQLTLTGTAEAGSEVLIFDGSTQIGTAAASTSGSWSFATGALADGTHAFTGKAMDAAGNVSVISAPLDVTIDTVAPNAPSITSGTAAASDMVLVSGTAEAGSTISLYEGTTLLGTAVTASNGAWNITTGSLAQGIHVFTATSTDVAGNVSGSSATFDPVVGTLIEAAGVTDLTAVGKDYYLSTGGNNVVLKYAGAPVAAGQFGTWSPVGAEETSSGYDIAWKDSVSGNFAVWTSDSNANFVSKILPNVTGTSSALESIEQVFHQDLNGDGVIGIPTVTVAQIPATTSIEASGTTSLDKLGSNYLLDTIGGSSEGPTLKYAGAAVVAGQFGTWSPVGAEATSSGYDVAWKDSVSGNYSVWTTDSNGNFASKIIGSVSGTDASLKAIESVFHQDLNGDGVIDTASTVLDISGKVVLPLANMIQAATIEAGAKLELTGAVSGAITFNAATGTLALDHASQFTGKLIGLSGDGTAANSDQIDLKDIAFGSGTSESYSGSTTGGVLTVLDAQNHTAHISLVGDYTHSTFNLSSDGNGGTMVIDPPIEQFSFSAAKASTLPSETPTHPVTAAGDAFTFARTAAAAPAQAQTSIDHAQDPALLAASHIQSSFDHVLEQGAPHIDVVSHVDTTDLHGFLLHA